MSSQGHPQSSNRFGDQSQNGESSQYMEPNDIEDQEFQGEDDEENIIDNDQIEDQLDNQVASSDSQLQVEDPSQSIKQTDKYQQQIEEEEDPMTQYYRQQDAILQWLANHPGQKWRDSEFPCNLRQFYEDQTNEPQWSPTLKNLQWKRPQQIIKDPKFMIIDEDKNGKSVDIDIKHGIFARNWFVGALSIISSRLPALEKLIVEKQYFERGFVSFQFFKNGKWVQVIVDTLLPYQKEQNNRNCVYSSCNNPQQFWVSLIEKAYVKLHRNYENSCKTDILQALVDLTGGLSQVSQLQVKQNMAVAKVDHTNIWNSLHYFYTQRFFISCINTSNMQQNFKNAEQGQQGILENHHYTIIDMREFPKDNLRLLRLRNPWGSEGVWTGPFCEEADDWEKFKAVKQDVKNAPKTKKSDGSWWMSLNDFMLQFDKVIVNKVFPQNWEVYSIQGEWTGKTNGGRCPTNLNQMIENKTFGMIGEKTHLQPQQGHTLQHRNFLIDTKSKQSKLPDHIQFQSDDRWFNNPQFRIKVNKDTKLYISLMQQDQKITGQHYVPCSFMICISKSRTERIWERPPENQIIAEINSHGMITNQREITHYLILKKFQKSPGIYMIIPNIVDTNKDALKKDESRKFYLRLFSPDPLDVTQLSETTQTSLEGQWTQNSAGGSRKIQIKEDGMGKKKGDIKDNPNWCKNPQYLISIKQPTMVKIILRKTGNKKYKGWRIGMTVCRYEVPQQKVSQKQLKRDKKKTGTHNLKKLLQQTSEYLQAPEVRDFQRKLLIQSHQKFKQSVYASEQVSALFFKWNPTEGPFIVVPSSDGEQRVFNYRLTVYSNNPIDMMKLDESRNQVMIGKWEKDISAGGCHLNEKDKQAAHRTWSMNPKYLVTFKEQDIRDLQEQPIRMKVTLAIAEKNWKKLNPNTVSGMIGLYLLEKRQGKLTYSEDVVVKQTSFLPVKQITMDVTIGEGRPFNKQGYLIMPSTYESKIQGTFILSVKCDRPFEIISSK